FGPQPSEKLGEPTAGFPGTRTPASAPSRPWYQAGFPVMTPLPSSYSSGYSPIVHTLPSSSCARHVSSASTRPPFAQSRSYDTRDLTPPTVIVRSVTLICIRRLIVTPSSVTEVPSNVMRSPGFIGNSGFVSSVGLVNFAFSNGSCRSSCPHHSAHAGALARPRIIATARQEPSRRAPLPAQVRSAVLSYVLTRFSIGRPFPSLSR